MLLRALDYTHEGLMIERTLRILCLAQKSARLLPVDNRTVDGCNVCHAMAEVPLKLVHVVRAFASPACVLAVYRVHPHSSGADTQDEGVLSTTNVSMG